MKPVFRCSVLKGTIMDTINSRLEMLSLSSFLQNIIMKMKLKMRSFQPKLLKDTCNKKWLLSAVREANKPKNRILYSRIITMRHRPLYCSSANRCPNEMLEAILIIEDLPIKLVLNKSQRLNQSVCFVKYTPSNVPYFPNHNRH